MDHTQPTPGYGWRRVEVLKKPRRYQPRVVIADIVLGFCKRSTLPYYYTIISAYFLKMDIQKEDNNARYMVTRWKAVYSLLYEYRHSAIYSWIVFLYGWSTLLSYSESCTAHHCLSFDRLTVYWWGRYVHDTKPHISISNYYFCCWNSHWFGSSASHPLPPKTINNKNWVFLYAISLFFEERFGLD